MGSAGSKTQFLLQRNQLSGPSQLRRRKSKVVGARPRGPAAGVSALWLGGLAGGRPRPVDRLEPGPAPPPSGLILGLIANNTGFLLLLGVRVRHLHPDPACAADSQPSVGAGHGAFVGRLAAGVRTPHPLRAAGASRPGRSRAKRGGGFVGSPLLDDAAHRGRELPWHLIESEEKSLRILQTLSWIHEGIRHRRGRDATDLHPT